MKGNYHKKSTLYSGWSRAEIWSYSNKYGTRKKVKTCENRRYRRLTKRELESD